MNKDRYRHMKGTTRCHVRHCSFVLRLMNWWLLLQTFTAVLFIVSSSDSNQQADTGNVTLAVMLFKHFTAQREPPTWVFLADRCIRCMFNSQAIDRASRAASLRLLLLECSVPIHRNHAQHITGVC